MLTIHFVYNVNEDDIFCSNITNLATLRGDMLVRQNYISQHSLWYYKNDKVHR